VGAAVCLNCGADLLDELLKGLSSVGNDEQRQLASCGLVLCELCRSQPGTNEVGSIPWRRTVLIENTVSMGVGPLTLANDYNDGLRIECMLIKINALIADISKHRVAEKRFVDEESSFSLY
jgi:hypothetical protein